MLRASGFLKQAQRPDKKRFRKTAIRNALVSVHATNNMGDTQGRKDYARVSPIVGVKLGEASQGDCEGEDRLSQCSWIPTDARAGLGGRIAGH